MDGGGASRTVIGFYELNFIFLVFFTCLADFLLASFVASLYLTHSLGSLVNLSILLCQNSLTHHALALSLLPSKSAIPFFYA